jgi:hypothetical protein
MAVEDARIAVIDFFDALSHLAGKWLNLPFLKWMMRINLW